RPDGAGEFLAVALATRDQRDSQLGFNRLLVELENPERFVLGFGFGFVRGVTLLPKELGRAQKWTRHFFPAHDVRPLIGENWQIAPRVYPLGVHRADDRLRGRSDDEPFL